MDESSLGRTGGVLPRRRTIEQVSDDERAACGDLGSGTRRCAAGLVAGEGNLLEFVVLDELGLHILHQEASL